MFPLRFRQIATPIPSGRLVVLDELKGWAIVLVIIYHAGGVLGWSNPLHGEIGVDIFLLISGFTLTRSSAELSAGAFLRRRLVRIFPAYWVALALFIYLDAVYFGAHLSTGDLVTHVLGLHGFVLNHGEYFSAVNDSFWFVSLILLLYIAFLGVRQHLADLSRVIATGLLLTTLVSWAYLEANHQGGLIHLAVRIPSFFLGVIAGQLTRPEASELRITGWLAVGALALTYLGFLRGVITFYAFAAPSIIVALAVARRTFVRHPDGRFLLRCLAWLGVYSYEIFLFHQPLIRDFNHIYWSRTFGIDAPTTWELAVGIGGALVLTLGLSYAVHHLVEYIFRRRLSFLAPRVSHAP